MPDVQHSTLTAAELHEPKGVASAAAGAVYIANGAGSGSWSQPVVDADDGTAGQVPVADGAGDVVWTAREYHIYGVIADVSTAETVYVPIPYSGSVAKFVTVLEGAITVADAVVTLKNNAGTAMGAATIAFTGSAAGDVDFNASLTNNTVTDNDFVTIETDGGSTTAQRIWFTITVERND